MLKNISPLISPVLLQILAEMGHGDQLALVDANFPAASHTNRLIRLDGVSATELLAAVLYLFPIDDFCDSPAYSMAVVDDEAARLPIVKQFNRLLSEAEDRNITCQPLEREEFYRQTKLSYAVVITGEKRLYGNILIQKGIILPNKND